MNSLIIIRINDETPDSWITDTVNQISKEFCVLIIYQGYDDDPRELYEIEGPSRKIVKLGVALQTVGISLVDESLVLVTLCSRFLKNKNNSNEN